jgi:hypothetical protein
MRIIESDKFIAIPVYFNLLERCKEKTFSLQSIDANYSALIAAEIKKHGNDKIFAIDFQFVTAFPNSSEKVFKVFSEMPEYCLFFYNIQEKVLSKSLIVEELRSDSSRLDEYDYDICTFSSENISEAGKCTAIVLNGTERHYGDNTQILKELKMLYAQKMSDFLKEANCVEEVRQYLPSSDVYSNQYIKIKSLFSHPSFNFCIYLLCKMIKDYFPKERIDAIVSMSNTGAVLANLVGKMLNKDVIFCTNVGPKFALNAHRISGKIPKDCNCLCVFDFVCLGTEIKNLNTLLMCFDANLIGGVGVAAFPSFDRLRSHDDKTEEKQSILTKMYSIIAVNDHGFNYDISMHSKENGGE